MPQVRAAGVKACVASQGKVSKTDLTLSLTGLRDLFDEHELFSAHTVPRGKPHPDLLLHAGWHGAIFHVLLRPYTLL